MKSTTVRSLTPTLSAIAWIKYPLAACLCLVISVSLCLIVGADSLTVTADTVSGASLMESLSTARYTSALPDEPSSPYVQTFNLTLATVADGSSLGDGFDVIKCGNVPPNAVTDGSYFYQLDFGGLNFDRKKVMSLSLPVAFMIGYNSDINGGFAARLTVDGKPVGNFVDCLPDGTINLRHDGSVLMDCYLFRCVLSYQLPTPTSTLSIGVSIYRKDTSSPFIAPQDFAFSCGRLSYEYVSSEQIDVVTPEQSQAAQDLQDAYSSTAQGIHDQLDQLPDTAITMPPVEIDPPKEFDVFNSWALDDLPYIWTIVSTAFTFSVLSIVLYGVKK